jgi:hypothetical protein
VAAELAKVATAVRWLAFIPHADKTNAVIAYAANRMTPSNPNWTTLGYHNEIYSQF